MRLKIIVLALSPRLNCRISNAGTSIGSGFSPSDPNPLPSYMTPLRQPSAKCRRFRYTALTNSISLLTPFTPISHPLDWSIGTHGIHITFSPPSASLSPGSQAKQRPYSATYLPEVCAEQGWTKEEAVLSAIQKAGFRGRVKVGDDVWESLRVKRYGSVKAGAGWGEYEEWQASKDGE